MAKKTPREHFSEKLRTDIFGTNVSGVRSPTWVAEKLGIPKSTAYWWRDNPDKIPAWQYVRIMSMIQK